MFDWHLNNGWGINQVKRLSDNEVFSVGDKTDEGIIRKFYIEDNVLNVGTEERGGGLLLWEIEKVKEPILLFTTEDGVKIFEGDEGWAVYNDFTYVHYTKINGNWKENDEHWFSTEDRAKEYIAYNKPMLTAKEIFSISAKYGAALVDFERDVEALIKTKMS